ncbi:MAG TPA: DEAD/DEAH box helicase family protein [Phycisphaerales bacterium]|nr:DEAD/DEAH box helicase family protein [Phycisphaerales bacterium]
MALTYRPYQLRAQESVRDAWAIRLPDEPHPMVVCATGCGKTELGLGLIEEAARAGKRILWCAHREELVVEPLERLTAYWPDLAPRAGIVQASRDDRDRQIIFASIPTLAAGGGDRLERILAHGPIDHVVVDEAHHSPSRTHTAVIDRILSLGGLALGLTATPDRDDGLDLGRRWEIVYAYGIVDAIREGWLVPPWAAVSRLAKLDLSKVSGRRDYDDAELGAALLLAGVVEHTVQAMAEAHQATRLPERDRSAEMTAKGRATIVFTATIEQARLTSEALTAAGWRAAYVCDATPKAGRRRLIKYFREGRVDVLCNAAVLTEGTDLPRAACLVLARPTKSWSLFTQMIGRGLRLYGLPKTDPHNNARDPVYLERGGKTDCLVIDLAGATEEHSLIAAAVLIGASRCASSPNGQHSFQPAPRDPTGGICEHCERKVACLAAALTGGPGGHEWNADAHCKHCDRPQCAESETGRHAWVPDFESEKPRRVCIVCGVAVADPLGSMVGERKRETGPTARGAYMRLYGLEPPTYGMSLDQHGALFIVQDRPGWFRPYWVVKGGRRARAITAGPISGAEVRAQIDDLVRRAARVADPRKPGEYLYGQYGEDVRHRLTLRALQLGLAQEGTASNSEASGLLEAAK